MYRSLFAALFVSSLTVQTMMADGPSAVRSSQRTTAVEKQLDTPLNWKPKAQREVTLSELIDFIHEEHELQVRWDIGALRLIHSEESPIAHTAFVGNTCGLACVTPQYGGSPYVGVSGPVVQGSPYPLRPSAAPAPQPQYATATTPTAPTPLVPAGSKPAPSTPTFQAPTPLVPAESKPAPSTTLQAPTPLVPAESKPAPSTPAQKVADAATPDEQENGPEALIAKYLKKPISLSAVSLDRATVGEALDRMLGEVAVDTSSLPFEAGLPLTTRAFQLTLLVDGGSVLITTRLRANATKETRVYRLGELAEMPSESLTRVITHTVRPWSWRGHADEIADRLVSRWPNAAIPLPGIELSMTEGIKLASAESAAQPNAVPDVTEENIAATGQLLAGGAAATMHSIVAACEIVHHGDPPTGVIESLPGMLIITQSQAAHREIRELLSELARTE